MTEPDPPPTLYRRARLIDGRLAAVQVRGERVAWVGPDGDPGGPHGPHGGPAGRTVDLDGALLLPAFVDGHVHLTETGLLLDGVGLASARSVTEVLDRVAAAVRDGRDVVLGHGWDELLLAERRPPTRQELDRASGDGQVYLSRVDVHSAVVSTALARRAGLPGMTGWDDAGRVERDAHHAVRRLSRHHLSATDRNRLQRLALTAAATAGLAEVHEMSAPHVAPVADLAAALDLGRQAGVPRVVGYLGEAATTREHALRLAESVPVAGLVGLAGDLMVDGSIGSRTAALAEDYTDAPGHRGHLYLGPEQVRDHVVACTGAGLQAGFHAIGDAAVATVLAGFEEAARITGLPAMRAAGHRVEHVEAIEAAGVAQLARLGVAASVQPAFDAFWGGPGGMYETRLGGPRAAGLNPFAGMAAAGTRLIFGSDSPVTPFAPWRAVRAALRHGTPRHRLGLVPALQASVGVPDLVPVVGAIADLAGWRLPAPHHAGTAGAPRSGPVDLLAEVLGGDGPPPVCAALLIRGRLRVRNGEPEITVR